MESLFQIIILLAASATLFYGKSFYRIYISILAIPAGILFGATIGIFSLDPTVVVVLSIIGGVTFGVLAIYFHLLGIFFVSGLIGLLLSGLLSALVDAPGDVFSLIGFIGFGILGVKFHKYVLIRLIGATSGAMAWFAVNLNEFSNIELDSWANIFSEKWAAFMFALFAYTLFSVRYNLLRERIIRQMNHEDYICYRYLYRFSIVFLVISLIQVSTNVSTFWGQLIGAANIEPLSWPIFALALAKISMWMREKEDRSKVIKGFYPAQLLMAMAFSVLVITPILSLPIFDFQGIFILRLGHEFAFFLVKIILMPGLIYYIIRSVKDTPHTIKQSSESSTL